MMMKTWTINDAQSHFIEILESSAQEPQIIADKGEPVAALVDITLFNEFIAFKQRPTIAELLNEFKEIQAEELVELDLPDRRDRSNPLLENY
jgi:prevent-host-death family protein